ncbi:MAG: hypothetical protein GX245_05035 [Eubacteriaceae bacterium]|jgi:4-hydroxy-2-oxoheptanedioate aldolase|nr:hypothetical protein [Eubacteriaceae bacterium]
MSKIRKMIQEGKKPIGTFYDLGGQTAMECIALSGIDYIIIDTEHGSIDLETAKMAICAAEYRGSVPFVRVKEISRAAILKMLDAGAKGLVIPCVKTVDEVKKIVEYGKYFPVGNRGFAHTAASAFGTSEYANDLEKHFQQSNEKTLLIPQCETVECLEDLENIVAVDGVDGIFVGPFDLSISLGIPGQMTNPIMVDAMKRIQKVCKDAGKLSFIFSGSVADSKLKLGWGYDSVTCGMDAMFLLNAYQNLVAEIRS